MTGRADIVTIVILSALGMLALIGVAVLLLIVAHTRRLRHRADMVELEMHHAEEVRQVEREVVAHTLSEIGQELHDNVGQLLTAVRMDINAVLLATNNNAVATGMKGTLDIAIAEVRRLSHTLIADQLRDQPISEALGKECQRLHRPGTLDVIFLADGEEPQLPPDHKVVLYRMFQEGMNNALKHARASRITVTLSNNGKVRLEIQDNGTGFDREAQAMAGQGIQNIRRRSELIGFHCQLSSKPGEGTTVLLTQ